MSHWYDWDKVEKKIEKVGHHLQFHYEKKGEALHIYDQHGFVTRCTGLDEFLTFERVVQSVLLQTIGKKNDSVSQ